MYIPPSFRIDDAAKLSAFMDSHSFASVISCDKEGVPCASHLPMRHMVERQVCTTLVGHMARANPQWKHFRDDVEVLTIFHGPHAYISPSWYATDMAVPTWNYAAVHVYGRPRIMEDHDAVVSLLEDTVGFYEQSFEKPWPGMLPSEFRDQLIRSIVAFEISVTRVEGKYKLGQNRDQEDIWRVHQELSSSDDPQSHALAAFMRSEKLV